MLSNRSKCLALAAILALLDSACLHPQRDHHAPAVKAEAQTDLARVQAEALRTAQDEPEYFEGEAPPAAPAAPAEARPSAPSTGHVWISGHHTRRGGEWVWVSGRYALPPRDDVVWVPGHWVSHLRGYVWISGAWR